MSNTFQCQQNMNSLSKYENILSLPNQISFLLDIRLRGELRKGKREGERDGSWEVHCAICM